MLRLSSSAPSSERGTLLPLAQFGVDFGTNYSRKRLNNVIGLFGVRDLPMTVAYRMRSETTWARFPGSSDGKKSPYNAGDPGSIPGLGRSPWRREWLPSPVFLPGESHGQRSLAGCSPWGHKESDTTKGLTLSLFKHGTRGRMGQATEPAKGRNAFLSRQVHNCPLQGLLLKALPLPRGMTRNATRALMNGLSGYNPKRGFVLLYRSNSDNTTGLGGSCGDLHKPNRLGNKWDSFPSGSFCPEEVQCFKQSDPEG